MGASLYVLVLALHEEGPCIGLEAQLHGSAPLPGVRSALSQRVPFEEPHPEEPHPRNLTQVGVRHHGRQYSPVLNIATC